MALSPFIISANELINAHGSVVTYSAVTDGTYDSNTGTVTNTEVTTSIKAYPKRITATPYNYPSLVDKQLTQFLIAGNALASKPKTNDKVTLGTDVYTVNQVQEITADNIVCLYRCLSIKG